MSVTTYIAKHISEQFAALTAAGGGVAAVGAVSPEVAVMAAETAVTSSSKVGFVAKVATIDPTGLAILTGAIGAVAFYLLRHDYEKTVEHDKRSPLFS